MKNITKIIKKVLKEETKDNDDYLMFVTLTGGRLIIPKSANPKITSTWNSEKFKSNLDTLEEIRSYALKDRKAKKVCETYHKDENLDTCFSRLVQFYNNISVDGGVISFTATLPEGNRENFTACFRTSEGDKPLDFDKRYLSGYFPQATPDGCTGNPWRLNKKKNDKSGSTTSDSDSKQSDIESKDGFSQDIRLKISLPLTKG
jgi:hypothetical protein